MIRNILERGFNHVSCDVFGVSVVIHWAGRVDGRLDDLIGAFAGGGAPVCDLCVAAAPLLLQVRTVAVLVSIGTWVGAQFVVTGIGTVTTRWSRRVGVGVLVVTRWAVVTHIEVFVLGVGTVGHGTSNLVGAVPHQLCVVSNHPSVDRSHTVAIVFNLIVPGLDGAVPRVLITGHVQVLTTSTGADGPLAGGAVVHGAAVGPFLSVSRCFVVPTHLQHVTGSRLHSSPQSVVFVHNVILV